MSNVSNPSGPVGPLNPHRPAEPAKPGTKEFKDLMKVKGSPEKQKKHKKRSEEDPKQKISAGPASPDKEVKEAKKTKEYATVEKIGESDKKQKKEQKRPEEKVTELAREEAAALAQKKPVQPMEVSKIGESKEEAKIDITSQQIKDVQKNIEEEEQIVEKEEIAEKFEKAVLKKQEPKKETPSQPPGALSSTTLGPLFLAPAAAAPPAYALMSGQTLQLFEKMIAMISIMQDSGMSETTIHLDSHYYGAQIIIREYSSAPLTYNIELVGNPMAVALFRKNLNLLRSAFDDPKLRYRVHRLDASLDQKKDST